MHLFVFHKRILVYKIVLLNGYQKEEEKLLAANMYFM